MHSASVRLASPEDLAAEVRGRGPLYALLDAARSPDVLSCLERSGEIFESLYAGRRGEQLAAVAPYLAQVSHGSSLLALAGAGWGRSWGFLVAARVPFADVRRHFRRFLTVETEAGEALSFRFYDPRVLRPFLASATEDERRAFFGPCEAFFVEDRSPGTLLRLERAGAAVPAPAPPWDLPRIRDAQLPFFAEALAEEQRLRRLERRAERLRRWSSKA